MKNLILIIVIISLFGCSGDSYTPKPRGYFRIDLPAKSYSIISTDCPYTFEIPDYAVLNNDKNNPTKSCWFDLDFPSLKASIYLSYKPVNNNLDTFLEDSRTLAFKHTVKASNIEQSPIIKNEKSVFGMIYNIEGDAASDYQFHLTDSNNHFLRGSLYFNTAPNQDSIKPVLDFIKEDIEHIFETFEWKN